MIDLINKKLQGHLGDSYCIVARMPFRRYAALTHKPLTVNMLASHNRICLQMGEECGILLLCASQQLLVCFTSKDSSHPVVFARPFRVALAGYILDDYVRLLFANFSLVSHCIVRQWVKHFHHGSIYMIGAC